MVIVFSKHANNSKHVATEISIAMECCDLIIPFRIEDAVPSGDFKYLLRNRHWMDAVSPPVEKRIIELGMYLRKWFGCEPAEPAEAVQSPLPAVTPPEPPLPKLPVRDGQWAFVSGVWDLIFCPEPGVTSEVRVSPGAAFQILADSEFQGKKYTRIRLEDNREGWLEGAAGLTAKEGGRTLPFSMEDTRIFLATRHENPSRQGFLLTNVNVVQGGTRGTGGFQDALRFVDTTWGDVSIQMSRIQRIEIDRRSEPRKVAILTDNREYNGEFPAPTAAGFGSAYLIVTRPFVGLTDMRKEIDLRTIDYAVLERIDTPPHSGREQQEDSNPMEKPVTARVRHMCGRNQPGLGCFGWLIVSRNGWQYRSGEELDLQKKITEGPSGYTAHWMGSGSKNTRQVSYEFKDNTEGQDKDMPNCLCLKISWKINQGANKIHDKVDTFVFGWDYFSWDNFSEEREEFAAVRGAFDRWFADWK